MAFHITLKHFAKRRWIADSKALFLLGTDEFAFLFELFSSKADQLIAVAPIQPKSVSGSFEVIACCLKCTRRISSHGCSNLSNLQSINLLFA